MIIMKIFGIYLRNFSAWQPSHGSSFFCLIDATYQSVVSTESSITCSCRDSERERERKRQRYACLRSFFCSFFFLPVVVNNLNAYRGECIYRMRVYLLHIIDIICISPLLSHLSLSLTFSSLFWSHSTGCHRPGPSCPCPLLYPFWDHVMWASTASCDDDHVDNLGAGEAVAFDRALCACRFSGFSELSMGEGGEEEW